MGRYGPESVSIVSSLGIAAIPVGAHTAVVYSKSFSLEFGVNFCFALKAASTTINLKVEIEQSFRLPVTEGSADDYWIVETAGHTIIDGLANSTIYLKAMSPAALKYGRLKISTKTGHTEGTLSAWMSKLQDI